MSATLCRWNAGDVLLRLALGVVGVHFLRPYNSIRQIVDREVMGDGTWLIRSIFPVYLGSN